MDVVPGHHRPVMFGEGIEAMFIQVGVNYDGDVGFKVDNSSGTVQESENWLRLFLFLNGFIFIFL